MGLNKLLGILLLMSILTACDKSKSNTDDTSPATPSSTSITTDANGKLTISGKAEPESTITITFPDGSKQTTKADSDGNYSLTTDAPTLSGDIKITSTDSNENTSEAAIETYSDTIPPSTPTSNSLSASDDGKLTIEGNAEPNTTINVTFPDGSTKTTKAAADGSYSISSTDFQKSGQVTITSSDAASNTSMKASIEDKVVTKALYLATGIMPELAFSPTLGINTEGPQGGADTAGMPMPFVDIFRTARSFKELSETGTTFDNNGWPIKLAENFNYARTKLLQGTMDNALPEGEYTVIYDGTGSLELSGAIENLKKESNENKYTFDLTLNSFDPEDEVAASSENAINLNIKGDIGGVVDTKNIRIVMPGGTCSGNPFIHINSGSECPNGTTYESFAERLQDDRNAIIFNPDYLLFLRNFKVIRMMNLMEASLKKLCFSADDCPEEVGTWEHRAKMNDAVWGGNDQRTPDEDHKGVPVEVMIALANTVKRDIWVNMPHVSSDDYVSQYAKQVYNDLDSSLNIYIEYSNEVWNPGFAGHAYTTSEGNRLGLDEVPYDIEQYCDTLSTEQRENNTRCHGDYHSRLRFFSQRSVEIFKLWEDEFNTSSSRFTRVLGSFIGDKVLTESMIEYLSPDDIQHVDAVAIAPYFYGCPTATACPNANKALIDATTVDDIFDIIDQKGDVDVKSLEGTINAVKIQLAVAKKYNLNLVSYEGGQHLVTGVLSGIEESEKPRLRKLFNDANRDSRMTERYIRFLNAWKNLSEDGATLFTLYTMPQSYYRYGNFGIKEHLNMPRSESPKFDGVMTFQETAKNCWWDGCNP